MNKTGKILWLDLTVENAEQIRDFYCKVVGWTFSEQSMGDYADYNILSADGETVTGICHKKGSNSNLPTLWLNYVTVENISVSIENCQNLGGKVIDGPRKMGSADFAVIQDPAGAYMALYQENE